MAGVLHLVAGTTDAGKTTYAIALATRENAIRLSIDEWMTALFGPDQPPELEFEWMMVRVNRCEAQMWSVAKQAAELGVSVVIDCGLTREVHRTKWAELAASEGLPISLHHFDVDVSERWHRVQNRNVERGTTFRLEVTRGMFDFVETLWETPSDAEMQWLNGNRIP